MSSGKRYKFIGSSFQVQTGLGSAKLITAISQADPAVVTSNAHGFTLGTVVKLDNIDGMTQVDGGVYAVDNPAVNSYELAGVDSTAYDAFVNSSPTLAEARPATFTSFCELTGSNQQDGSADQNEVTTICSSAKEFEQGLPDSGTLQLDYNYAPNQPVQAALLAAKKSGDQTAFKITMPNNGGIVIMIGTVQSTSFQGSVGDPVWKGSASIKLSGDIFVLEAS
jgi:hypothetical protein